MSLFFVDSGSELTAGEIKKLGIECVSSPYVLNEEKLEYNEESFDATRFYSKLKKDYKSQYYHLGEEEYIQIFEPCLQQNDDIVYVHSSCNLINMDNLNSAKKTLLEKYPDRRIEFIDSSNFSIGQGLISYQLALQYRKGATIDELIEYAKNLKNEFALYIIIDSLDQLYNHNMLSGTVSGTALNIKPIVTVDIDGKFQIIEKVSGKKKALAKIIEMLRQYGKNVADFPIGIVYTNNESDAIQLKEKLIELYGNDTKIMLEQMSPNNCAYLGMNSIGISFHVHKKIY